MKIGIDARHLSLVRTGVETYSSHMLEALARLGLPHRVMLIAEGPLTVPFPMPEGWEVLSTGRSGLPFFAWACPVACRKAGVDVFYSPVTAVPLWGPGAVAACTVYDLLCYRYPQGFPLRYLLLQRLWLSLSAHRARRLVVISENTRTDLEALFPWTQGRVAVAQPAVDPFFLQQTNAGAVAAIKARLGLDGPFILTVGTLQPRKNLSRLAGAFEHLKTARGLPHHLVVVGQAGWLTAGLSRSLDRGRIKDWVRVTGYLAKEDLRALYAGADLVVVPSLYEGFGLPILEGMACGAPVACSRASSFPEAGGDAALYFDPTSEDAMAQAMETVLRDEGLRRRLIDRGHRQARAFSWDRSARIVAACLEAAARER